MPTEELFTPRYYGILRDSVSDAPTAYDPSSIEVAETPESAYADAQARFDRNMIRIGATNIQNGNVFAFTKYNKNLPKDGPMGAVTSRMLFLPAPDTLLELFDSTSNDSILIGFTYSSVYRFYLDQPLAYAPSFYAIGGDGGPNIQVANFSTNGEDPLGDFWKCSESGPNRYEVITYDDVKYCMPKKILVYDKVFDYGRQLELGPEVLTTNSFWQALRDVWLEQNGTLSETDLININRTRVRGLYPEITSDADSSEGWNGDHSLMGHAAHYGGYSYTGGIFPPNDVPIYIPWDSSVIEGVILRNDGRPEANPDIFGTMAQSAYDTLFDTYSAIMGSQTVRQEPLRNYRQELLVEEFAATNPARESEYQVQYGNLEANRLIYLYGDSKNPFLINNIFMGMAQYLATTYIESVYTFKTVKMPPISPRNFIPQTLSEARASVDIDEYSVSSTPFSPESYYADVYAADVGFPSPAPPTSAGFMMEPTDAGRGRAAAELASASETYEPFTAGTTVELDRPSEFMPSGMPGGSY